MYAIRSYYGIPAEDLQEAWQTKIEKGGRLGDLLIKRKIVTERQLLEAQSTLYDIPFEPNLPLTNISNEYTQIVSIQFLKKSYNFV